MEVLWKIADLKDAAEYKNEPFFFFCQVMTWKHIVNPACF